jgi:tetratricopeptide (TPR) repeat protein
MRSRRAASLLLILLTAGCGQRCGKKPEVAEAPVEPATPADPLLQRLGALKTSTPGPTSPEDVRETFRRDAAGLATDAIDGKRLDVVVAVADALRAAGEPTAAEATLQRSIGLQPPSGSEKSHLVALARLRLSSGRSIEGASLLERAVDLAPSTEAEWTMLSNAYLFAGRPGPAKAAVTRGLLEHPGSRALRLQGADAALAVGELERADAEATALLAEKRDAEAVAIRAEVRIAQGRIDEAKADLSEGPADHPRVPLLRHAIARLSGETPPVPAAPDGEEGLALWADALTPSVPPSARSRALPSAEPPAVAPAAPVAVDVPGGSPVPPKP